MFKVADIGLTTIFLLYFSWYVILGIGFGGLKAIFYILLTISGLICILNSVLTKSRRVFFWTRLIGLLFVPALIFYDVKSSYTSEKLWQNIEAILTYLPTIIFGAYTLYSIVRLRTIPGQKSG